jgi:hypothetical protein
MAKDRKAGILITVNRPFQEEFMLDHLHQKAARTLASAHAVMLSTYGPADIQTSRVPSAAQDLTLYAFIPYSSDHLLNLEHRPGIVAATDEWELRGTARALPVGEIPTGIQPAEEADGPKPPRGCVVEIRPTRLTLHARSGQGNLETIDF